MWQKVKRLVLAIGSTVGILMAGGETEPFMPWLNVAGLALFGVCMQAAGEEIGRYER